MFDHTTEFFQAHLKKLTLNLTLFSEGSCRDPEENSEGLGSHSHRKDGAYVAQYMEEW